MASRPRILLTGASGFLGAAVLEALGRQGFEVRVALRTPGRLTGTATSSAPIGDMRGPIDWGPALEGCEVVLHLAAIAHQRASPDLIHAVNGRAPVDLARAAARAGVRRMAFVSSVKAVGEDSGDAIWSEDVPPKPTTTYGEAKRVAEMGILAVDGLETIILRPPLVHAPDARANFARLLDVATLPVSPPLGGLSNRRSFISRAGFAARIAAAARPGGPTGIYFVAEDPPLSTSQAVAALRRGSGRTDRLSPAPRALRGLAPFRPLFASLAVSEAKFRSAFPDVGTRDAVEALEDTARARAKARR